jgi:hypothetical protein
MNKESEREQAARARREAGLSRVERGVWHESPGPRTAFAPATGRAVAALRNRLQRVYEEDSGYVE